MSLSVSAAPAELGASRPPRPKRARIVTRWLLVGAAAVGMVVAAALFQPPKADRLDPQTPGKQGAKATAVVLADHGVTVQVVRSVEELVATPAEDATVVIVNPDRLSDRAADTAVQAIGRARRVVLVGPTTRILKAMHLDLESMPGWTGAPIPPGCSTSVARTEETVGDGALAYRPTGDASGWTLCFRQDAPDGAGRIAIGHLPGGAEVVVTGFVRNLNNELISRDANAALYLRLLGSTPDLVWYVPGASDLADSAADGPPPGLEFPTWFAPLTTLLATGVILLALVRGRRLGRVVPEPLPVVVRAAETTENRGRLYRRAADRQRTARILQAGTRDRLGARLGVSPSGPPDPLTHAVSQATGIPQEEARRLLLLPIDNTDVALVALARQLSDLEEQVRTR